MAQDQNVIQQGFMTPDGKVFATKSEAVDHIRRPLKTEALLKIAGADNGELVEWLIDNQESIEATFESTKIRRVTKSEKKQLEKALEAVKAAGDKAFGFIIENAEAIADSFRWPSVKRGTEEEQAATIKAGFMVMTENNSDLSDWIIANKEAVLEAYQAGVVKKQLAPNAAKGLAEYQAKKRAEKAAAEAAKAAATEAAQG